MAGDGMLTPVTAHWGDIHFAPWCPMALQPRFLLPVLIGLLLSGCSSVARHTGHPQATGQVQAIPPLPPPPAWTDGIAALYDRALRVDGLDPRTFAPEHWWRLVTPLLTDANGFRVREIGRSVEGRPLRHVAWGNGPRRVLLWSQMHGDESTATMALADLFRFLAEHPDHPLAKRLRENTTLHFLPLMNPDGAARFRRENAQGIDINRDAAALASPEARALKSLYDQVRPQFGFNLHDQRPGYRAGDSDKATAIALLSPPFDASGAINDVRTRAIEVAVAIRAMLEPELAGHIARWDEDFTPTAFGDLTTQWGTSTVLIEAGGIEGDPQKQVLRRHYFMALLAALDAIATGDHAGLDPGHYFDLPQNGEVWPDLLIRGGTLLSPGLPSRRVDILIDFKQPLSEEGGRIKEVGDLTDIDVRRTIDANGLYIQPLPCPARDGETRPGAGSITPGKPACLQISRDAAGRDIVWTLLRDVDPTHRTPSGD